MQTINIDGKEFKIDCSAYTLISYKKFFNKGIIEEIKRINDFYLKQASIVKEIMKENPGVSMEEIEKKLGLEMLNFADEFIIGITKIAWILIYTADPNIANYDLWLKSIKKINIEDKWISEVTELAVDSFR